MSSGDILKKVNGKKLIHKDGKSLFSWQGFDWRGYKLASERVACRQSK